MDIEPALDLEGVHRQRHPIGDKPAPTDAELTRWPRTPGTILLVGPVLSTGRPTPETNLVRADVLVVPVNESLANQ